MEPSLLSGDPRSFESVIFWLTAYYAIERGLRHVSRSTDPVFYQKLLSTRKDLPYFGIAMGFLITLFSAPTCGYAAYTAIYPWQPQPSPTESISGMVSASGAICVVSRSILWVSELNRLGEHDFYLYHHLGSLVSLLSLVAARVPLGALYGVYAGLVSELTGDLVWLARAHGATLETSTWLRRLEIANTAQYVVLRAPGIIFAFYFIANGGLDTLRQLVCTGNLVLYTGFVAYCFVTSAVKLRWPEHPALVRVAGDHVFTAYGVLIGLGAVFLALGAVAPYPQSTDETRPCLGSSCM
ncbi:hypothetical protein Q9L58_010049 [Maublancomyces gigas]|uniref:TLC domain-containing protein n=1 Tax=Discina gigas TaxID=1032678 RepID=A0ABR3G5N1_9PEZI